MCSSSLHDDCQAERIYEETRRHRRESDSAGGLGIQRLPSGTFRSPPRSVSLIGRRKSESEGRAASTLVMNRTASKEFAWTEARVESMMNIPEHIASGEDAWTEERLVHRMRDDYRASTTKCTVALRIFPYGVNCAVRTRARARYKTLDPAISETRLYAWRRLKTIPQPLAVRPDHDPERRSLSPANDQSGCDAGERHQSGRNEVVASDGEGVSNRSNSTPSAASDNGNSEASDSNATRTAIRPRNAIRNHSKAEERR